MTHKIRSFVLVLAVVAASACDPGAEVATPPAVEAAEQFSGDWPAIIDRGTIRLARRSWTGFETLPSQGLSTEQYRRLAEGFAARHGLAVDWVIVADMAEIFAVLHRGRADVAVHNITVLPSRAERVAFSVPLTRSREWVIGRREDGVFGVADGTAYVESLAAHYPDAERAPVPETPIRARSPPSSRPARSTLRSWTRRRPASWCGPAPRSGNSASCPNSTHMPGRFARPTPCSRTPSTPTCTNGTASMKRSWPTGAGLRFERPSGCAC